MVTFNEAARILGVRRQKIHSLVRDGVLTVEGTNPLDKRQKLIPRNQVDSLVRRYKRD